MVSCRVRGDFKESFRFLKKLAKLDFESLLKRYGDEGVKALAEATPKRTGKTAASGKKEAEEAECCLADPSPDSLYFLCFAGFCAFGRFRLAFDE